MGKLVRSEDKKVAGVCAGVAEHFGWNVKNVRIIWLILSILGKTIGILKDCRGKV